MLWGSYHDQGHAPPRREEEKKIGDVDIAAGVRISRAGIDNQVRKQDWYFY